PDAGVGVVQAVDLDVVHGRAGAVLDLDHTGAADPAAVVADVAVLDHHVLGLDVQAAGDPLAVEHGAVLGHRDHPGGAAGVDGQAVRAGGAAVTGVRRTGPATGLQGRPRVLRVGAAGRRGRTGRRAGR